MHALLSNSLERFMIYAFCAISVALGTVVAYVADRYRRRQRLMETVSGILLIAGFALLGYLLELAFGRP